MMKATKILGAILLIISCIAYADEQAAKIYTVKPQAIKQKLFYAGTVAPLNTQAITSIENGVIDHLNFEYGQKVTKGQLLFSVKSKTFQDHFVSSIKTYLTAKQSLHQSQTKLKEQEGLWKYGLISRDSFVSVKTELYNSQLALFQAQQQMISLLEDHKHLNVNYQHLDLSNIPELKRVLSAQFESDIKIYSPATGIALIPDKNANQGLNQNDGGAQSGPVVRGSAVQQNQAVLSVGDLSGITIKIDINEVNVNQIEPGLKAIVTSVAFPGIVLHGEVVSVGSQASSQNSSIPTFPVIVKIEKLTAAQRQVIRVGMSAKVELIVSNAAKISVPLKAVIQKEGQSYVKLKTAQGEKLEAITTGETTLHNVVVRSGLTSGDKIVVLD